MIVVLVGFSVSDRVELVKKYNRYDPVGVSRFIDDQNRMRKLDNNTEVISHDIDSWDSENKTLVGVATQFLDVWNVWTTDPNIYIANKSEIVISEKEYENETYIIGKWIPFYTIHGSRALTVSLEIEDTAKWVKDKFGDVETNFYCFTLD